MAGEASRRSMADAKADLTRLGQTLHPNAVYQDVPPPPASPEGVRLVCLERVVPGVTPAFRLHGYATCMFCRQYCWLGEQSLGVVSAREAFPVCRECLEAKMIPGSKPIGHVIDE